MLLLARSKGLRVHDYLVFLVDRSYAIVALNHALTGLQFGRFVIRDITFDFVTLFTFALPWAVRLYELIYLVKGFV